MTEILQQLAQADTETLLWINGMHCELLDYFMTMVSYRFTWIPLYASFLLVLAKNFDRKTVLTTLLAVVVVVLLCDQTASGLLKPMVGRLRPSNPDNPISGMVHIVNGYRGGRYGFPSSHSANSWGMAFLGMYLARNRKLNVFLAFWATLMCYSRVYLGVHYPGDILTGFVIAVAMSSLTYLFLSKWPAGYVSAWRKDATAGTKQPKTMKLGYLPITVGTASLALMLVASGAMCLL